MKQGYWRQVARRLGRDPVTLAAIFVLLGVLIMMIFAPYVTTVTRSPRVTYAPLPNGNNQSAGGIGSRL